jgi:hypothetical protein
MPAMPAQRRGTPPGNESPGGIVHLLTIWDDGEARKGGHVTGPTWRLKMHDRRAWTGPVCDAGLQPRRQGVWCGGTIDRAGVTNTESATMQRQGIAAGAAGAAQKHPVCIRRFLFRSVVCGGGWIWGNRKRPWRLRIWGPREILRKNEWTLYMYIQPTQLASVARL